MNDWMNEWMNEYQPMTLWVLLEESFSVVQEEQIGFIHVTNTSSNAAQLSVRSSS